eukprot:gene8001-13908_t
MEGTKKTKLQVNTADGKTTSTTRKIEEVTNHFKQCFYNENLGPDQNKQETIKPEKITKPFTTEEIQKAIKKLKNNKAAGCDNIIAEQLKHSPEIVAEEIATIFNDMVRTGKYPEEIKKGILIPLQKPGKEKGPTINLRPIMLMTMLRKTLALCMLERINPRIQENIPISQAAYRQGRSTTEQVQAFKLLAEKAITTEDTEYTITLIDMSKAFDTVNRKTLIEDLKHIVNKEELYILSKLINDTEIQVKIDGEVGQQFRTTEGVAQGEGLSPILFTLYLAKAFKEDSTTYPSQDHNYTSNAPEIHQLGFEMEEQYADDCGWIHENAEKGKQKIEKTITRLKDRNLNVNNDKTEIFKIKRGETTDWKKCKILGSYLDTETDNENRRRLTITAMSKLPHIWTKGKSITTKKKILSSLVEPIFMYNAELWNVTTTLEKKIAGFQHRILRWMLGVKWQEKKKNTEIDKIAGMTSWVDKIKEKRRRWTGHMLRLDDETPLKKALREARRPGRAHRGRKKYIWITQTMTKDFKDMQLDGWNEAERAVQDRVLWRRTVKRIFFFFFFFFFHYLMYTML